MKPNQLYQRRSRNQTGPSVPLFPFLAVLICTMGALVPLLLAISRTARLQAETAALAKATEYQGQLKIDIEDVRWRIEQLKQSRSQTESQLTDARLVLGHIEDHTRRLREQLAEYQQTAGNLQKIRTIDQQQRERTQAELERVRSQVETARRELQQYRNATPHRSYAVVPYEGPNQTHRRPIYLECRADAVVVQPEGIELTEADFEGPMGPGNPLAAAMRAAREHLAPAEASDPEAGEPYPLLLVPPEGILAYYAAREALKSWGYEFGYELIDSNWKLTYPPPDPRLAEVMQQAIASARVSQARLAAAAPRHYGNRAKVTYRASPTRGGFIREGGPAGDDDAYRPVAPASMYGRNHGPPPGALQESYDGQVDTGRGALPPGAMEEGNRRPLGGATLQAGTSTVPTNPYRNTTVNRTERPEGYVVGQPPREHPAAENKKPSNAVAGYALRPGEWQEKPDMPPPKKPCPEAKSLAEKRGVDWGLRDAARGSVGVARPVIVECYADRVIVVSERGADYNRVVPLGDRAETSIDMLISAVWEQMESWGIAGRGMYWRPVLKVHVAPDADARFAELAALLDGSGLIVERR